MWYEVEDVKNELQHIKINGYIGKWSAFEKLEIIGKETYYIMEHDTYGDMTQYLVITADCETIYETYDDIVTCLEDECIL